MGLFIILTSKPKIQHEKENRCSSPLEYGCRNLKQNHLSTLNPVMYLERQCIIARWIYSRDTRWVSVNKLIMSLVHDQVKAESPHHRLVGDMGLPGPRSKERKTEHRKERKKATGGLAKSEGWFCICSITKHPCRINTDCVCFHQQPNYFS